jgi:hypothetical protein
VAQNAFSIRKEAGKCKYAKGTSSEGENVEEIQALTQRVNDLGQAVDFWNLFMLWGLALAAGAAIVIGVSTRLIVLRTGQQAEVQAALAVAKEGKLSSELKEKDRQIAVLDAKAKEAEGGIETAKANAVEASAKAEGFRLDIAKANEAAALAQAQVEGAKAEAAKANLELERVKSPRTLKNLSTLTESLKAFKGTEYTFSLVFGDEESITLLRQLDGILTECGWVRIKPPHAYPAINIYGQEQDFAVPNGLTSGIKIMVDSDVPLTTLQTTPVNNLPPPTGASVALAMALTDNLSPSQEAGIKAIVEAGKSPTVRIQVGRKP